MNKPIDPYHIIKLLTDPNVFDVIVDTELKFINHTNPNKIGNMKRAFDLANEHFFEATGNYKFSSYDSWRINKFQKRKRAKNKKQFLYKQM